jgi:hypothetical protein
MPEFPQFRKYINQETYFRINSFDSFDELKIVGKMFMLNSFKASILPDRNFISDLLSNEFSNCEVIPAEHFEERLTYCQKELQQF